MVLLSDENAKVHLTTEKYGRLSWRPFVSGATNPKRASGPFCRAEWFLLTSGLTVWEYPIEAAYKIGVLSYFDVLQST